MAIPVLSFVCFDYIPKDDRSQVFSRFGMKACARQTFMRGREGQALHIYNTRTRVSAGLLNAYVYRDGALRGTAGRHPAVRMARQTQGAHAGARNVKAAARDAGATYAILSRGGSEVSAAGGG